MTTVGCRARAAGKTQHIVVAALLLLCGVAAPSAGTGCPPAEDNSPPLRYSREDVAAGRLPETAALDRTLLRVDNERVSVAIVTDAGRDLLDDSWPAFRPQSRLMLVALDSGQLIWELVQAAHATAHETVSSDPRLTAPFGAASVLHSPDGLAQRLYMGDGNARVWRIDLPAVSQTPTQEPGTQEATTGWRLTLLAELTTPGSGGPRQFRVAPDLVRSIDSTGRPFDGVLISSEGAVSAAPDEVGNGLFFLRDYAVQTRVPGEAPPEVITWPDLAPSQDEGLSGSGAGWFARFQTDAEIAHHRPLTDGGRVFLVTALPASTCGEPPLALTYVFNLSDGRPFEAIVPGFIAGVGRLGGPVIDDREILLPGRGVALPMNAEDGNRRFRARFTAQGIFARVAYWRDFLLDAD